jgi:hypothetical protein
MPEPDTSTNPAIDDKATGVPSIFPDQLPMLRHLDPAAALAFRTPLENPPLSADSKAAAILTLLGLMFTITGRFASQLGGMLWGGGWQRLVAILLLGGFVLCALSAVVQAFRTISPRFPKVPPSLAFFGDIARLSREEYVAKVESLTPEQALDQMLLYNHTVATICIEKFRQLRRGLRFFEAAFGFWFLLMLVLAWRLMW